MKTTFSAHVASDLYQAGYSCDGHPFIAEQFYVVVENEAGRRFHHQVTFNGAEVICNEDTDGETVFFADVRKEASAKAERLAQRVNAALVDGVSLDSDCWYEVDPAYGSDAYVNQGTELKRVFAEKAAA